MDAAEPLSEHEAPPAGARLMLVENPAEVRVLGVLMEKEMSTPAYYPMTVNSITAACNQKNNRDPVVQYDEASVVASIEALRKKTLVSAISGTGYRVQKYKHNANHVYKLSYPEEAVICLLLLRGPQTPGELRSRSAALHPFEGLEQLDTVIHSLSDRPFPLVQRLARAAGQKEARFMHLLSGTPHPEAEHVAHEPVEKQLGERVLFLENELESLRAEMQNLQNTFAEFRKQFE